MDWLDLLLLPLTIIFVVSVILLRRMLGLPIASVLPRAVPGALPVPASLRDLWPGLTETLHGLGFVEAGWGVYQWPGTEMPATPVCGWQHAQSGLLVLLGPPLNAAYPNQPLVQVVSRSAGGARVTITQWCDPGAELLSVGGFRGRTGREPTLTGLVQGHLDDCRTRGETPEPWPEAPWDWAGWLAGFSEQRRLDLLAAGRLVPDGLGRSVPSWTSAIRMLGKLLGNGSRLTGPVPVPRLQFLAGFVRGGELLAPDRSRQWFLFLASSVLFVVLGAAFWDLAVALILMLVIGIHELGHFLAMRAFGYRNTQMLALPLVGGVAMGHEDQPRAAARAWMSLAGPVPGIIIGWLLLASLLVPAVLESLGPHLMLVLQAATIFLFLNYLNLLPVPPLDGGHVVQALLPRHAFAAQGWFVLVALGLGIWLAWRMDWTLLLALFVLQLFSVPQHFANARVMRVLRDDPALAPSVPRGQRLRSVLETFERLQGPTPRALPRIQQAEATLRHLELEPMSGRQRGLLFAVLALCLAVPVALALSSRWEARMLVGLFMPDLTTSDAALEEHQKAYLALMQQAGQKTLPELLDAAAQPGARQPATGSDLQDAGHRVGMVLPDEVIAVYRHDARGAPGYGLRSLSQVARLDVATGVMAPWRDWFANPEFVPQIWDEAAEEPESLTVAGLADTLLLAEPQAESLLVYQPAAPDRAARYLLVWSEEATSYANLREALAAQWLQREALTLVE